MACHFKIPGHDELEYVDSETGLHNAHNFSQQMLTDEAMLIDNIGNVYRLVVGVDDKIKPLITDNSVSLIQFIKLVQQHAAMNGECCIEKISFKKINDGMAILASMRDT